MGIAGFYGTNCTLLWSCRITFIFLVTPHVVATKWLGPLKGFTAHEANRILYRRGQPFWQDESYDHLVRSGREFERIRGYIETNPVKAGLAAAAERFRWSSAAG